MQRCTGDGGFELWRHDLDATGGFYAVKVDPALSGVSHLRHALRPLEPLDVGRKRPVLTGEHDGVADIEFAPIEDDIDGFAHADLVSHLQNGSLCRPEGIGQTVFEETLGQADGDRQQVLEPFSLLGRHGDEGDVLAEISDLVVAFEIKPVLGELTDGLPVPVFKQRTNIFSLSLERLNEGTPSLASPTVKAVNLVSSNDKWRTCFFEDVEGLDGLGLQALHDVNHQDGDVSHRPAPVSK